MRTLFVAIVAIIFALVAASAHAALAPRNWDSADTVLKDGDIPIACASLASQAQYVCQRNFWGSWFVRCNPSGTEVLQYECDSQDCTGTCDYRRTFSENGGFQAPGLRAHGFRSWNWSRQVYYVNGGIVQLRQFRNCSSTEIFDSISMPASATVCIPGRDGRSESFKFQIGNGAQPSETRWNNRRCDSASSETFAPGQDGCATKGGAAWKATAYTGAQSGWSVGSPSSSNYYAVVFQQSSAGSVAFTMALLAVVAMVLALLF